MKTLADKIVDEYVPHETSLRQVANICGTDHHKVKRVLDERGITIVRCRRGAFTDEHRRNISRACKGRRSWSKGKKMPRCSIYKNMRAHLRFDVELDWLMQFSNIEMLKFINSAISDRGGRFDLDSRAYISFIEKSYKDERFIAMYHKWLAHDKCKWLRPTVDHVTPVSKGGARTVENLSWLTWLENRAKCDMTPEEWFHVKANIKEYMS